MFPTKTDVAAGWVEIAAAVQAVVTFSVAVTLPDPNAAGSVAVMVALPAAFAVALNGALAVFAGTATLAGVDAIDALLDVRVIVVGAKGTTGSSVTVKACVFPVETLAVGGASAIFGLTTVVVQVRDASPGTAHVTGVGAVTAIVVVPAATAVTGISTTAMVKGAVVGTAIVAGTVATEGLLDDNVSAEGAGLMVTMPFAVAPGII